VANPPNKKPSQGGKKSLPDDSKSVIDPDLASEIEKRVTSIVGKQRAGQVLTQVLSLVLEEKFSGPIAHPRHLREYEEILPGSAERIIKMAEDTLDHNRKMQQIALDADIKDRRDGRLLGFLALIALAVLAFFAGIYGQPIVSGLLLGTAALGAVVAIINGRRKDSS
jgi:uncharacterized membrane protein